MEGILKEELITPQTAKLAKEKGFNIQPDKYGCNYYTGEPHNKWKLLPLEKLSISWMEFPAPTQSLLQKWLKEVYNIYIDIRLHGEGYFFYLSQARSPFTVLFISEKYSDTYEEALEYALQEGLKLKYLTKQS